MTDPSLNPAQTREIDRLTAIIEARDTMSDVEAVTTALHETRVSGCTGEAGLEHTHADRGYIIVRSDELQAATSAYLRNDHKGLMGAMADLCATLEKGTKA